MKVSGRHWTVLVVIFISILVFNRCGSGKNPAGGSDIATYRWYEELPVGAW